jgi:hypothetical protein
MSSVLHRPILKEEEKRANKGGSSEHRMIPRYIKSTASKQWMNISLQAATDDPMHEFIHVDKSN